MSLLARLAEAFAAASPIHDGRQLGDLHHMAAWPIGDRTMEAEKTCKTCRWFMPKTETSPMNFCRRFPPGPVTIQDPETGDIRMHFTFAVVSGANACGEHSPKEEAK